MRLSPVGYLITSGTFYQDRDICEPHSKLVELEFLGWAQVHIFFFLVHMFLKTNSVGDYDMCLDKNDHF